MPLLDETHDSNRRSWVASANAPDADFPLQNLPFGVFEGPGGGPRAGIAIGDKVLDLSAAFTLGLLPGALELAPHCRRPDLNGLMALGRPAFALLRREAFALLCETCADRETASEALVPSADIRMLLPVRIGDFTDFYTSAAHARRGARLTRPDAPPLYPNFLNMPIAYHGRASSVCVSGTPCVRPRGQTSQTLTQGADGETRAHYAPTDKLDFELEVGFYIGRGNALGKSIPLGEAEDSVVGLCLVNDWSARDLQRWESQPLGPFLGKSFMTSVSPWIVTLDALAPFRVPPPVRPVDAPQLAAQLTNTSHEQHGGLDVVLRVSMRTARMRSSNAPYVDLTQTGFGEQYWTVFQMLTHHASNGCNLRPGDLLASGTISGEQAGSEGCLFEKTEDGTALLSLPNGERRGYLKDGDEIHFQGRCSRPGFRPIGFGACTGIIQPAETMIQ